MFFQGGFVLSFHPAEGFMSVDTIIDRQSDISNGHFPDLSLPKLRTYCVCNLRGGIGKTTIAFNLAFLGDSVLAVDTCPQGNLSYYFDHDYFSGALTNVGSLIKPHILPGGFGRASHVARLAGATNHFFHDKKTYFIPSASDLYLLPSQVATALNQINTLIGSEFTARRDDIIFGLRDEVQREIEELNGEVDKCLIDTSPFFAGATQLAWYASDALIVPVRTDQQSINSFELLLATLTSSSSEYRRHVSPDFSTPKIQLVVLTHCGWSTRPGVSNEPNNQTRVYINKVYDLLRRYKSILTTDNVDNHILLLDDFLGSGRISSAMSQPLALLTPRMTRTIDRQKVTVNASVTKCQNQLKFLCSQIW